MEALALGISRGRGQGTGIKWGSHKVLTLGQAELKGEKAGKGKSYGKNFLKKRFVSMYLKGRAMERRRDIERKIFCSLAHTTEG